MPEVETTHDEEEIVTEEQPDKAHEDTEDFDWKADALKHRAIATRLKVKLAKVPQTFNKPNEELKIDEDLKKDVSYLKEVESKRQFGFEHNLSPKETDLAFRFSGGKADPKILEDEFFKAGIEALRSKERLSNNLPGSSSRSTVFTEKSFAETPEEDRKKIFESKMKGIRK